jgi:translation initiation factor IF-2
VTSRDGESTRRKIVGEQLVGIVRDYFDQPHVAFVEVIAGELRVGDTIRIAGVQCDFVQQVRSMELEHDPVNSAKIGDFVGVQVSERVRKYDRVYREASD